MKGQRSQPKKLCEKESAATFGGEVSEVRTLTKIQYSIKTNLKLKFNFKIIEVGRLCYRVKMFPAQTACFISVWVWIWWAMKNCPGNTKGAKCERIVLVLLQKNSQTIKFAFKFWNWHFASYGLIQVQGLKHCLKIFVSVYRDIFHPKPNYNSTPFKIAIRQIHAYLHHIVRDASIKTDGSLLSASQSRKSNGRNVDAVCKSSSSIKSVGVFNGILWSSARKRISSKYFFFNGGA